MEQTPFIKQDELKKNHQSAAAGGLAGEYTDFINIAVHDLDAPLRKLTVLMGMLMDKLSPDPDTQTYIDRIHNCVTDMRSLVDDLSVLGIVTTDKPGNSSCEIDNIIRQSIRELPEALKEKKAVITIAASLPVIEGNALQYQRLFKNILGNAIKFSKKDRQPQIQIESSILPPDEKDHFDLAADREYYKIEIADNGIGFKEELSEKIFRPLVHLYGKSQFPGNGVGLAICKKIIDNHQGIIYAQSRENEGARFILILPETQT